jgi:hypothetical protein
MDHEQCDACGFDGSLLDDRDLLDGLRSLGPAWRTLLAASGDELRARPAPATWSAVEYAAHSRDVTTLHVWAVEQALGGHEPVLPEVAADDLIESAAGDYAEADPADVADVLEDQADRLADVADHAGPGAWTWGITIGGSRSDVRRLLEHGLHDSRHHLDDVERGLAELRGARG